MKSLPEQDLMRSIRAYLAECPQAMDTLEGIAAWWVLRQEIRLQVASVERAVRRLVSGGILEEVRTATGTRYRLRRPPEN